MSAEARRAMGANGYPSVCSQCVADRLEVRPPGPTNDYLCGPHMDLMRIDLWRRQAQRRAA